MYDDGLGASFHGQEELRGFVTAVLAAIPDFSWTITSLLAEGDRVFCEGMISGVQVGDLPNLPATGKRFEIPYVSTDEFSDGLIRRHADYWNLVTYMQQVGIMPTNPA